MNRQEREAADQAEYQVSLQRANEAIIEGNVGYSYRPARPDSYTPPRPDVSRPAETREAPGRALGIAAIACGVLGFLFLPIVFGPVALILGIVSVAQRYDLGWVAIVLGSVQVFIVAKAFYDLSTALQSIGS